MANQFNNNAHYQQEGIHDCTCTQDSKLRPPNYNAANRCCAEVGSYTDGQAAQPAPYDNTYYPVETAHHVYHVPESNISASSSNTFPAPRGVEREAPNLLAEKHHTFLAVGPEAGLNEVQHQCSAVFHADPPYCLREWLKQQHSVIEAGFDQSPYDAVSHSGPAASTFLPQGIHIQSSMAVNHSSRRSKPSERGGSSLGAAEGGFISWGVDPVQGTGSWADEGEGNIYPGSAYPPIVNDYDYEWND